MQAQSPTMSIWTLPNTLTASRVVMVPIIGALWVAPLGLGPVGNRWVRTFLFVLAAFTDWLDGYLSRRMNLVSNFGAFFDPVADKLMVAAVLVFLTADWGLIVGVPAAVIIFREIGVSALREWMASVGERDMVAVSMAGKLKTTAQLISMSFLVALPPPLQRGLVGELRPLWPTGLQFGAVSLLYLAAALALVSGSQYFSAAWPSLSSVEQN